MYFFILRSKIPLQMTQFPRSEVLQFPFLQARYLAGTGQLIIYINFGETLSFREETW